MVSAFVVASLGALGPGGCGGGSARTVRVLLVGDSNARLVGAAPPDAWARASARHRVYVPVVHGVNGSGACPNARAEPPTGPPLWAPFVRSALTDRSGSRRVEVVVVQLGTNDALSAPTEAPCLADYVNAAVAPLVDAVWERDPDVPVVWVNQRTDYPDPSLVAAARLVNRQLVAAAARWKHFVVADFDAHFRMHPEWFYAGNIAADVHLDPAGVREYVRWMAGVLDRRPGV